MARAKLAPLASDLSVAGGTIDQPLVLRGYAGGKRRLATMPAASEPEVDGTGCSTHDRASQDQSVSLRLAGMQERAGPWCAETGAGCGRRAAASVGLLLHGATATLYLPSGLVAPDGAVALLYAAWLVILALGVRWRRRNPMRVLALPVVSVGFWITAVTIGDAHLGWTG